MARALDKYVKNNEYSKKNEYGKGSEKGKEKEKKGKGKGQGKDEKPAPNSSFQGYCRSRGKWEHMASECWQGYVQAVEKVPSSSASSVAPGAATTPAAAKTAASIKEINDEGSVASVTTGTDDLWDELELDSGSLSNSMSVCMVFGHQCERRRQGVLARHSATQNPIAWIKSASWAVGPEGRVECKVKFDVGDVAYPVVSLGKMIESGFTFSSDDYHSATCTKTTNVWRSFERVESSC